MGVVWNELLVKEHFNIKYLYIYLNICNEVATAGNYIPDPSWGLGQT